MSMNYTFKGKKVLVIGLARSGKAAIELLKILGAKIALSEKKVLDEQELAFLNKNDVEIFDQNMSVFEKDFDLVIKNPGVPPVSPIVKRLKQRNIPILSEIELAYQVAKPQHYIAITGSNGKTTTTTIVYELLKKAFKDKALVGGNIGTPLCELVLKYDLMHNAGYYISLEISNHQLVDIDQFEPEISTIINLSPDHLSTMGSLDAYYKSKTEVYRNMKQDDLFLFNSDDQLIKEYAQRYPINCKIATFSLENNTSDCHINGNYIYYKDEKVLPLSEIKLVGKHNIQNIMIAIMIGKELNIANQDIQEVISNFKGVEHRLEFVREINGIRYFNDSKATNTDATITALKAFDKNVILLVGGYEKGLDMADVKKQLGCVKAIIGFGVAGKRIGKDLSETAYIVQDLKQALDKANSLAEKGDVILLSPTTSSFDQYSGYEQRGAHFKELVNQL